MSWFGLQVEIPTSIELLLNYFPFPFVAINIYIIFYIFIIYCHKVLLREMSCEDGFDTACSGYNFKDKIQN